MLLMKFLIIKEKLIPLSLLMKTLKRNENVPIYYILNIIGCQDQILPYATKIQYTLLPKLFVCEPEVDNATSRPELFFA